MSATAIEAVTEQTEGALLADLITEIQELRKSHDEILALVSEIKEQVGPMIESLSNSPILKMMGVK